MRTVSALLVIILGFSLQGCGGQSAAGTSPTQQTATVNFVVSDTPSSAITVLSFQVQITGAVLQPGNVSILPRPVTVDLAQLVSDTGFLASSVIDSATYTSLTLTYANPQVTLMNTSAASIMLGNQTCAAGATCTYVPVLNNASVTISSGVFPLTVTAGTSSGINMDLSIPDLLQSDLSLSFANGSSVNLSLLPGSSPDSQQVDIDDVIGTISAVSASSINVTTAFGDSLILTSESSTAYVYPSAVCAASDASCPTVGQIVALDLGLIGNGALSIKSLSYLGASGSQLIKGLVLSTDLSGATPTARVLLQSTVNLTSVSSGQVATVSLPSGTSYLVGVPAYPAVASASFVSGADLMPGQELVLNVGADLITGGAVSFSSDQLILEASQAIGQVSSIDAADNSLSMDGLSSLFTGYRPAIQLIDVQTDSYTDFVGFSTASISAASTGQFLVAKGPLFTTSGGPAVAAIELRERASGN